MKRCILSSAVIFCVAFALVLPVVTALACTTVDEISVSVPVPTVDEEASFVARVNITEVIDFDACNYDIVFDHDVLTLTDVTDGLIGSTTIPVIAYNPWTHHGEVRVRVVQNIPGTSGVTGSGYLAELHFTVIGLDGSFSSITLKDGCLCDTDPNRITVTTWTPATVTVDLLTPDFTASPAEGYVEGPDVTTFTFSGSATGGTTSYTWLWDFGDTENSTFQSPTHTYASFGTYYVSLSVTDNLSSTRAMTRPDCVKVYDTLVADFSGTPLKGIKGSLLHPPTVQFSDNTTGGKTTYTAWAWTFGDTDNSTDQNPDHTYTPSGTMYGLSYTAKLTVNDALTAFDDETKIDYITIYQMGDINKDLTVDALDITKIELIIAKDPSHPETFTADANEDDDINALDITTTELLVVAATP